MSEAIHIDPSKMGGTAEPLTIPADATDGELSRAARQLARQKYDENDGDQKVAIKDLKRLFKQRPDIKAAFSDVALLEWFKHLLHTAAGDERERLARKVRNDEGDHPGFGNGATNGEAKEEWTAPGNLGEGMAARRHNDVVIFNWQIPHIAKKIGLAVKKDLGDVIARYDTSISRDSNIKAMLEDVMKRMAKAPVDKAVQDVIDPRELERLFRRHGVT